ncbi:unnamed protein product, partial [Trifolium pratense]
KFFSLSSPPLSLSYALTLSPHLTLSSLFLLPISSFTITSTPQPPPPSTNQSLVRVREWPSERSRRERSSGEEEEFRPREFLWPFVVTRRCLATAAMKLLAPSFLWFDLKLLKLDVRELAIQFGCVRIIPYVRYGLKLIIMQSFLILAWQGIAKIVVIVGHLTTNSDVYSFGVVLLEILTGELVLDMTKYGRDNLVYKRHTRTLEKLQVPNLNVGNLKHADGQSPNLVELTVLQTDQGIHLA